jgi:hypothetical protein
MDGYEGSWKITAGALEKQYAPKLNSTLSVLLRGRPTSLALGNRLLF